MDVATFKTIVTIQKENMRLIKEYDKENPNPVQESRKQEWTSFMKKAVKASKKTKGKVKSALKKAKRAEKERTERDTEECLKLHNKLHSDFLNFSDEDLSRYHHLRYHCVLDERKLPGQVLDYDPRGKKPPT